MPRLIGPVVLSLGIAVAMPLYPAAAQTRTRPQPPRGEAPRRPEPGDRGKAAPRTAPPRPPDRPRPQAGTRPLPPGPRPRPIPPNPTRGSTVFIGGYFYDPFFGPRPWWPPIYQPVWPTIIDDRAHLRIKVRPETTAIYVDGYYAGVAEDFDGYWQALPLIPGGHTITLYLEGYVTISRRLYLGPATSTKLVETMQLLPPGAQSEPPTLSTELPPPPVGTFAYPRTPRWNQPVPPDGPRIGPPLPELDGEGK